MSKIHKSLFTIFTLLAAMSVFSLPAAHAVTIKIATLSPDGTFWMKSMRDGADEIEKRTAGRVKFKFYPGGVMGEDANVLRKIRIGQLHGGAITIGSIADHAPDVTVYGLPFLFDSLDQAEQVREKSDDMLMKLIEKNGYISLGIAQGGYSYLMSKKPVRSFDDLRQQRSWVPENNDVGLSVFEYIGVSPISLPISDVLTGLQTGLVDNIFASPIGAVALQWHTHVNYVVDLPLNYLTATMVIDKKTFNKIGAEDQKIVREVMRDVYHKIDQQNRADNIAARKALENNGVKFVSLTEDEKQEWYRAGEHVMEHMKKTYKYDPAFYNYVVSGATASN